MQQAIGRLGKEIKDAVKEATSEGQGPLMEKSAELLANAITAELVNLKEQVGRMAEQFSEEFSGSSNELMKSVQKFQPTIEILSQTVENAQKTVINAVGKLNAHESVMDKMAIAATEVNRAAESFASMNETLLLSAKRNEEAANAQLLAAQLNEDVAEKFGHVGERLPEMRQTLEDAARVITSISGPIAELKIYLEKLPIIQGGIDENRVKLEDERTSKLLGMAGDLAEKVGKAAEQFSHVGTLAEKLNTAATTLDDASTGLATFSSHVRKASEEQRAASEAARAAALSGERTARALEPLPEAFSGLTTGLQKAGDSVRDGADKAGESYRELVVLQKQWFSGAELGLNAMKEKLQSIIKAYGEQIEGQTRNLMNQWTSEVSSCLQTYETQVGQLQGDLDELQEVLSNFKKN
jgi:methyl-accepting chemotaxis protein